MLTFNFIYPKSASCLLINIEHCSCQELVIFISSLVTAPQIIGGRGEQLLRYKWRSQLMKNMLINNGFKQTGWSSKSIIMYQI